MAQRIPIYRALQRPHLIMGTEPNLFLVAGALAGSPVIVSMTFISVVMGIALWGIAIWLFQQMAKVDPYMLAVYLRHIKYKRYYPARSTPWGGRCSPMRKVS